MPHTGDVTQLWLKCVSCAIQEHKQYNRWCVGHVWHVFHVCTVKAHTREVKQETSASDWLAQDTQSCLVSQQLGDSEALVQHKSSFFSFLSSPSDEQKCSRVFGLDMYSSTKNLGRCYPCLLSTCGSSQLTLGIKIVPNEGTDMIPVACAETTVCTSTVWTWPCAEVEKLTQTLIKTHTQSAATQIHTGQRPLFPLYVY